MAVARSKVANIAAISMPRKACQDRFAFRAVEVVVGGLGWYGFDVGGGGGCCDMWRKRNAALRLVMILAWFVWERESAATGLYGRLTYLQCGDNVSKSVHRLEKY